MKERMQVRCIARELASWAHNLSFADLPSDVVDMAKCRVLDALSTTINGRNLPHCLIALDLVRDNKGSSTVFTRGLKVPAIDAAFVNAILINSTAQDDTLGMSHPGSATIPAAFAIAEAVCSSGAEVLTAIIAGYDIMGRIYEGAPSISPRFRAHPVIAPFGAAVTAAKLLGLGEDQLVSAIGYAANFASGLNECFNSGTMEPKVHSGIGPRNGVMAALLAKSGASAAETTLEGKAGFYQAFAGTTEGLGVVAADLGKKYYIRDTTYKPYPICAVAQPSVDLALTLANKYDVKATDVVKVVEILPDFVGLVTGGNYRGPFTSHEQAIMSVPFTTAAALLRRNVASYFYYEDYGDPDVAQLVEKIETVEESGRKASKLEVYLRDGRRLSMEGTPYGTAGAGSDALVPTLERIQNKYDALTSDYPSSKVEKINEIVLSLDKMNNIGQLMIQLTDGSSIP